MSYPIRFNYSIDYATVDLNKIKDFHEFWRSDDERIVGFRNVELRYEEDGNLIEIVTDCSDARDEYGEYYDNELFAIKLSEVLRDGFVDLIFVGKDGMIWGVRVYPKEVCGLTPVLVRDEDLKTLRENGVDYRILII